MQVICQIHRTHDNICNNICVVKDKKVENNNVLLIIITVFITHHSSFQVELNSLCSSLPRDGVFFFLFKITSTTVHLFAAL